MFHPLQVIHGLEISSDLHQIQQSTWTLCTRARTVRSFSSSAVSSQLGHEDNKSKQLLNLKTGRQLINFKEGSCDRKSPPQKKKRHALHFSAHFFPMPHSSGCTSEAMQNVTWSDRRRGPLRCRRCQRAHFDPPQMPSTQFVPTVHKLQRALWHCCFIMFCQQDLFIRHCWWFWPE